MNQYKIKLLCINIMYKLFVLQIQKFKDMGHFVAQ